MILDFGCGLLNIDTLTSVGVVTVEKTTKVANGKFLGIFKKHKLEKTTTYSVVIRYFLNSITGEYTLTDFSDFISASKQVKDIKVQLEAGGVKYIDAAFENSLLKG